MSNTIRKEDILNCLQLLASVLGKRYGVEVVIDGDTACTDGHTIYLPSLPLDSDESLLVQVRGFIDHESAHIRFTDFEAFQRNVENPVLKYIINIIEDWRVEKAMSGIIPGCRANLNKLIPYLFSEPYKAPKEPRMAILSAILRTVRRWDVPTVSLSECLTFVNGHFPGLWPQIQGVLDRTRKKCTSTDDAITFAREILAILQQYCKTRTDASQEQNQTPAGLSEEGRHGEGSNDSQQSTARKSPEASYQDRNDSRSGAVTQDASETQDDGASDSQTPSNSPTACATDTSADAQPCQMSLGEADKAECSAPPTGQKDVKALLDASAAELPQDIGEIIRESLRRTCRGKKQQKRLSVARVRVKHTEPLSFAELTETKRATTALRTRLQNMLQAQTLCRSRPAQRGRLSSSRLYRLMIQDSNVFLDREPKKLVDTAVHILLDSSGSMECRIKLAGRACYAVGKALEAVHGISVGISVFPADRRGGIYPIVPHGKPVHNKFTMVASGKTPLAEALWWTMQNMILLPQPRKMILIVTDGQPDDPDSTLRAVVDAKKMGFELYGIGVDSDAICFYLPQSSTTIWEMSKLPAVMFNLFQKTLLRK